VVIDKSPKTAEENMSWHSIDQLFTEYWERLKERMEAARQQ